MTRSATTEVNVLGAGDGSRLAATVLAEGALEVRVAGQPDLVVLRTPGDDLDLTAGTLVGRGLASISSDVVAMRIAAGGAPDRPAGVDVTLAPGAPAPAHDARHAEPGDSVDTVRFDTELVSRLPARLGSALDHVVPDDGYAVGLFFPNGDLLCARHDVALRNAVDKVVGWALRQDLLPLRRCLMLVRGSLPADVVQSAVAAGVPVLAGTRRPTSLAVECARDSGLTLLGLLHESSMTVYAGEERLRPRAPGAAPVRGGCGEPWWLVRSRDGSMRVDVSSPLAWSRVCAALGLDPALTDPRHATEPLAAVGARWTTSELLAAMEAEEVPAAVVVGLDNSGAGE